MIEIINNDDDNMTMQMEIQMEGRLVADFLSCNIELYCDIINNSANDLKHEFQLILFLMR